MYCSLNDQVKRSMLLGQRKSRGILLVPTPVIRVIQTLERVKNSGSAHVRELRGGLSTGVRQRGPAAGAFPQKLCTIIRFKQKLFSKVCGLQHRPNCSYV